MIFKIALLVGVIYVVVKGINPVKKVESTQQQRPIEPETFTDYEELD